MTGNGDFDNEYLTIWESIYNTVLLFLRFMAIDRPSVKFLSFLRKHYNLASVIPQVTKGLSFPV